MSHDKSSARIVQSHYFHASAVAIGGLITHVKPERGGAPDDEEKKLRPPLPISGASCALPSNGGIVESSKGKLQTKYEEQNLVSFTSARARTEGLIVRDADTGALTAVTRASAEVMNLQIGDCQPMFVSSASGQLRARVPLPRERGQTELSVRLQVGPIEVYDATIEVDFHEVDSRRELEVESKRMDLGTLELGEYLGLKHDEGRLALVGSQRCRRVGREMMFTNLVRDIRIFGSSDRVRPVDGHPNALFVENVGHIFFGEAIITPSMQRFSLMRFEFGCNCQGGTTIGSLDSNGGP